MLGADQAPSLFCTPNKIAAGIPEFDACSFEGRHYTASQLPFHRPLLHSFRLGPNEQFNPGLPEIANPQELRTVHQVWVRKFGKKPSSTATVRSRLSS